MKKYGKHLTERPDVCIEALINNAGTLNDMIFASRNATLARSIRGSCLWHHLVDATGIAFVLKQKKAPLLTSVRPRTKTTPDTGAYSAAKAAMISYTQSLAKLMVTQAFDVMSSVQGL